MAAGLPKERMDAELVMQDDFIGCPCRNCYLTMIQGYLRTIQLHNGPGRVYTIGNDFKSFEEQGEFIEVNCRDVPNDLKGLFSVRISCDDQGNFWINAGKGTRVWLNNDQLYENTKLVSGDFITLGFPKLICPISRRIQMGVTFLFKTVPSEVQRSNNPGIELCELSPALSNSVVLRNIFSCLSVSDLKSVRSVCHVWKTVGDDSFREKSILECPRSYNSRYYDSDEFFTCVHDTKNFIPRNISLRHLPWDGREIEYYSTVLRDNQSWFLEQSRFFSGVRGLSIGANLQTKQMHRFLDKISPQVEELEVDGSAGANDLPNFPSLKKLTIKHPSYWKRENFEKNHWLSVRRLVPRVKTITSLKLEYTEHYYEVLLEKSYEFKNLTELILLESNKATAYYIGKLSCPLKKLELGNLMITQSYIFKLEAAIKVHAQSLEYLGFSAGGNFNIPKTFPNLKVLKIGYSAENNFHFNEGQSFCYEEQFPALQSLELLPVVDSKRTELEQPTSLRKSCEKYKILRQFFPQLPTYPLCSTLRTLEFSVNFAREMKKDESMIWGFGEMFPNVINPELEMIRNIIENPPKPRWSKVVERKVRGSKVFKFCRRVIFHK